MVQYVVDGLDPTGPVQLIAKIFTELRRAQLLCDHLQALSEWPVRGRKVPRSSAAGVSFRSENLVLYPSRAPGFRCINSVTTLASLDGVRDAARWLAKLHIVARAAAA